MIRQEDLPKVAKLANVPVEQVKQVADAMASFVEEKVKSEKKYTLPGFGSFVQTVKPARTARNPKTGESIQVEERVMIEFKITETLKRFFIGRV